jgi:hypothetical protein
MKTVVLSALAISIAVSLVACGGGGAGATPKDTFETLKKMGANKDFGGYWNMMSPSSQKQIEDQFKQMKDGWAQKPDEMKAGMEKELGDPTKFGSAKEFFIKMAEKNPEKATEVSKGEFVSVKEDGDKATVTFKVGGKEDNMKLEKVDGKWYVDIDG